MSKEKGRIYLVENEDNRLDILAGPFESSDLAERHLLNENYRNSEYYIIRVQRAVERQTVSTSDIKRKKFSGFAGVEEEKV